MRNQPSCSSVLQDLRRWIQTTIEYNSKNREGTELMTGITLLGELLEREIEKEKFKPFFHGSIHCSIRTNWYSGLQSHSQVSSLQPSRSSLKRKRSVNTTVSESAQKTVSHSVSEKSSGTKKTIVRRGIISSDSDDSDKDDDFSVSTVHETKKHKSSEAEEHKSVPKAKSSESRSTISVKLSLHHRDSSHERPSKPPAPAKPRSVSSSDQSLKDVLLQHLDRLMKNPKYNLFVDPVPRSCEDYYDIIQTPICLSGIRSRLQDYYYRSVGRFKKDMMLLVGNCVYYNMLLTPEQTENRKLAYALHRDLLRILQSRDVNPRGGKVDDLQSLERVYTDVLEKVYSVRKGEYQLILYFAVDNSRLKDYNHYVKNIINLRQIIDRMLAMDYYTSLTQTTDKNCLLNDFCQLFDNCITYWHRYRPSEGKKYIDAAQVLRRQVTTIMEGIENGLHDSVRHAFQAIREDKAQQRAALLEKKRAETKPTLLSPHADYYEKFAKPAAPAPITRPPPRLPESNELLGHTSGRWVTLVACKVVNPGTPRQCAV